MNIDDFYEATGATWGYTRGGGRGEETKSEKIPLGELKISCLMEEGEEPDGAEEGGEVKKIINAFS